MPNIFSGSQYFDVAVANWYKLSGRRQTSFHAIASFLEKALQRQDRRQTRRESRPTTSRMEPPSGVSRAVIWLVNWNSFAVWLEFRKVLWRMELDGIACTDWYKDALFHGLFIHISYHQCSFTVCLQDAFPYQWFPGAAHLPSSAQRHSNRAVHSRSVSDCKELPLEPCWPV